MSSNENEKCDCNKKLCLMNGVNWTRHLNACPVRKSKRKNQTIKTFFTLPRAKKICKDFIRISKCKLPTLFIFIVLLRDKNTDTLEVEGEKPTTSSSEYEKKIPEKSTFDGPYTADLGRYSYFYLKLYFDGKINTYQIPITEVMNTDDIENSNTTYEEPIVSATSTCLPVPEVIYNDVENGYVTNEELIVPDTCLPVPVPISEVDFVVKSNANASIVDLSTASMAEHLETNDIELNLTIQNFPNDPAYIPDYVSHAQLLLFIQLGPCQPLPSELIDNEYPKTTNTKTGKSEMSKALYTNNHRIDLKMVHGTNKQVVENREIVKVVIDALLYTARQNIALRGHNELKLSNNRGNFLELINLMGKYHPVLNSHLQKINNVSKNRISFLSNVSQNKLLDIMKVYTTTDLSSLEQVVFVLRYVYMGKIKERLIAFETVEDSSGKGIFDVFQKLMQQYNINWKEYLYAQSYDGAASMQGQYKGLKTLIQKENDKAIYVWCFAHRLNLVIVDTADASTNTKNFFGDLQALVNFMRARKRTAEFVKSQKLLQPLKRVRSMKNFSDTRWTSHGRVIEVIFSKFDALLDSLQKLSNSEDRITSAGANNFLKIITSFNFILSMIFMKNIFGITTPLSNYLQSKSLDFIETINLMNTSLKQLTHKRNDIEYEKLLLSWARIYMIKSFGVDGRIVAKFGFETGFGSRTWYAGRFVSFRMSVDFPEEICAMTLLWFNCPILCFCLISYIVNTYKKHALSCT
ncbi:hypothetical protein QTP88_008775 [Uroleucon formosanum]